MGRGKSGEDVRRLDTLPAPLHRAVMTIAPHAGLKVLELARILAGPWIGQTLADLGADVIKVESPDGDDTRGWGPPFVGARATEGRTAAYFHACNSGKRSVVADFATPEGAAILRAARRARRTC